MRGELFKILWRRNRWYLLLLASIILAFFFISSQSEVKRWQADWEDYQKSAGLVLENWQYESEVHVEGAKENRTEKDYLYERCKLFLYDELPEDVGLKVSWQSIYFASSIDRFLLLIIGLGVFLLFAMDYMGKFAYFLFCSRFSRKKSYWIKLLLVMAIILSTVSLGLTVYTLLFKQSIPDEYFNAPAGMIVKSSLMLLLKTIWVIAFSSLLGIFCGEWVTGLIFFVFLWLSSNSLIPSVHNFSMLFYGKSRLGDWIALWINKEFYHIFNWHILRFSDNYFSIIFYLLCSVLVIYWSYYGYQRISLENVGSFLIFPKYQKLAWYCLVGYCILIQMSGNFLYTFPLFSNEGDPSIALLLLFGSITAVMAAPLAYLLIYRRLPLVYHPFMAEGRWKK